MTPAATLRILPATTLAVLLSACSSMPKVSMPAWSMPNWSMPQWTALKSMSTPVPGTSSQEALANVRERPDMLVGITDDNTLITFNAGTPERLLNQVPIKGLVDGEQITGLDFDARRPALYALTNAGRVLTVDTDTGQIKSAGAVLKGVAGEHWCMDVDAKGQFLRMVSAEGAYWRLPLDAKTGQAGPVQIGPTLHYAPGDLLQGLKPRIVTLAYSHGTAQDPPVALAIDAATGFLVQQGRTLTATSDDAQVDEHLLNAVGPLGITRFDAATMDIAANSPAAYLVTTRAGVAENKLYELNLGSGQGRFIGLVGSARRLVAISIVPIVP